MLKAATTKRRSLIDFREDGVETERNIRRRYSGIYENVKKIKGSEDVKTFVFSCGFDGDRGLGAGLNQSSVDFILWLASSYHELIHIFRCGAQGKDQVENMAKKLYGPDGFFHDIQKYVGKSPVFVESLPTANSVADPDGVIKFLKKSGVFEDAAFGYVGAACWETKRIMPYDTPVPNITVNKEPMRTVYYENRDGSMRDKVMMLLEYGRPAYKELFERLEEEQDKKKIVTGLSSFFLGASYDLQNKYSTVVMKDRDPPEGEPENLFWCIVQTLNYYRMYVLALDIASPIYKNDFLMDISSWDLGSFVQHMKVFYSDNFHRGRVLRYLAQINFHFVRNPSAVFEMLDQRPFESTQVLCLLSFCFNLKFNIYKVSSRGDLEHVKSYYPFPSDFGSDAEFVRKCSIITVNLLLKKGSNGVFFYSALFQSDFGFAVVPVKREVVSRTDNISQPSIALPPPPLPDAKITVDLSLKADSETLPGFTHYSEVDWNEYLSPTKNSNDVLDQNALRIIENALRVPVKTHMSNVQTRYDIMEVDSKFYSPLLGWTVTGFRGTKVPSGMVQSVNKEINYEDDSYTLIFSDHVKRQRFFKAFLSDTLGDHYDIPKYAYNLTFYTTTESRGVRYANNYLREKSKFDYHFYDVCGTNKVQLKIKPGIVNGAVKFIDVSLNNVFISGNATSTSEYCQHRHKLVRTDWCGVYRYDAEHDSFKLVIKDPWLYPYQNTTNPLLPAKGEPEIQGEASYYLFFNRVVRRFCIVTQYQFLQQTNIDKKKFPWNIRDVKSLAYSDQYSNSYYKSDFWLNGEFIMDFDVKRAVVLDQKFEVSINPQSVNEFKFTCEGVFYPLTLKMRPPLRNLKIYYTVDEEIMQELEETFEVRLPSLQDKAKMWYSFMQSKPWSATDGVIAHKRALDDLDEGEALEENEMLTWKPQDSDDKWEFMDEKETKKEQEERERLQVRRKSKIKQLLREGILEYGEKMNVPGKMFWHAGKLYVESNKVINSDLQAMFHSHLQQSLPLKRGEMDLCIPEYRIHFEAQSFLDLGYLHEAGNTALLYNMCMSVYIALLSLWLQPNAYNQLDFKQSLLLNHLMADEWSSFQHFFDSVEKRLQQPSIKKFLIRDRERRTFILQTWKLEPRGVLRCVTVKTNDSYSKDLLLLANKKILANIKLVKDRQKTHNIRQKADLDFIHDIYLFDEVYQSVEAHLTVVPPTLPSPLPAVYQQVFIYTPDKRIPFVSFDVDYQNMGKFRFEEAAAHHHFVDFDPLQSDEPAIMSKYVEVYSSTFEACSNLNCLYMICMMIKYPDDPKYQKYKSRAFHGILNKIWIQVFQQYMGYTIERSFAVLTDKIHDAMCWSVRNAFKHFMFKDSKGFIFGFTASEAKRLKQNHSFINREFILNLWLEATETRSANFYSKEWSFGNLKEGIGYLKNLTKNRIMAQLKIAENRWDAVMLAMFDQLKLTKQQREIIKANVEVAFKKSPAYVSTAQYNILKATVDCDWSYDAQRDIFRDALHDLYEKQIEQLRIINSRDSITHYYNTINFWHVNLLRDAKKAYDSSKQKRKESWKINAYFLDRFWSVFFKIDPGLFTSHGPAPRPNLPESESTVESKSRSRFNAKGSSDNIEAAVPIGAIDISPEHTVANNLKVRKITQMVDAYSIFFSPLISPDMPKIEQGDDEVRFSQFGWKGLFSDPFEYNLGIYKLKRQGYDVCKQKNVRIFDANETSLFMQKGGEYISEFERADIKHAIFFTASGNVFHYIRSIPLTLKQYWFHHTAESAKTFEKLESILKSDPSIKKGRLFKENVAYVKQQRLDMIYDSLNTDDLSYDEFVDTAVLRDEITYVKKSILETKKRLEDLHNDGCLIAMTQDEGKLRLQLTQVQAKIDRMQGRSVVRSGELLKRKLAEKQVLLEQVNSLEEIRDRQHKALLVIRNRSIERDSRYLGTLEETLHSLQTEIADLPFKRNEQFLLDQIGALEEFLRKSKIAGNETEEIEECLREQRAELQENKKNHEAKMHLLAEMDKGLREDRVTRELGRIQSNQREIEMKTRDGYHNFLISQSRDMMKSHKQPEILKETEDLRDLLVQIPAASRNTWLAPLWFVELFVRECDSVNHTIIYRKFTDWVKRRVSQSTVEIESYCNCILYFLGGIKEKQGDFQFVPLKSHFVMNQRHFLQYDFADRTKEVLVNANREDILEAICSAVNLDVDVYEPYQNLKCALVAEPNSTQYSSTIMLNPTTSTTHVSKSQFFFDEKSGSLRVQNTDVQHVASFELPDHAIRSVVRGHNKPVFYVDLSRKRLVKNLGWDDGSEKNSFFKSLTLDGLFSDHVSASCEFVACLVRSINKSLETNKRAFNDIVSERLAELHEVFECELKGERSSTKSFDKLNSKQIWEYYCRFLCAALPTPVIHLSDYLFPTKSELQCFCDQTHSRMEIFNVVNEREFSVLDTSTATTVVEDTMLGENKPHVIQLLYFPPKGGTKGAFGRLIDCTDVPPSSLPARVKIFKTDDTDILGISAAWEQTYTRLHQSGEMADGIRRKVMELIKNCDISGVFNDDIFISESLENVFLFWRVSDSWFVHSLQQFYAILNWVSHDIEREVTPDPFLAFTARIDYTGDVTGQRDWYLKNNSLCKISVAGIEAGQQDAEQQQSAGEQTGEQALITGADGKVEPFKLHLLIPSCSTWPSEKQDPTFSRRFKGLTLFRQGGPMVPLRLWQANEGYRREMTEDNTFQGISRRKQSDTARLNRTGAENSDSDSDDSDEEGGGKQTKRAANFNRNNGGAYDDNKGGFDRKLRNDRKKFEKRESEGKGGNSAEKGGGGGWGTGKHNKAKDYVEIQESGTKRGGGKSKKAGAKNICPNRMFGQTLFGDPRARNKFFNYEGDRKVDHFQYFQDREQQTKDAQREEADELFHRARYAAELHKSLHRRDGLNRKRGVESEYYNNECNLHYLCATAGLEHGVPPLAFDYTVINEDLKPSFMLTTGLFESIVTLETFGFGDCVSIKLIQGMSEECITLALFLSCFFYDAATLCMFDQFTDNLTFAGKGYMPEMARFWGTTELLLSVADITPEQFVSLREKIPSIWHSRKYFLPFEDRGLDWHEHDKEIRENSTKLWWAHHRSLTIAALAFITCGLYGKVWPCKYITEEEAWKATQLLHKSKDSHDILQSLSYSPFGGQLKPIYDMAEYVAVRHPMRPIYTRGDRDVNATVEMFTRPAPAAAIMQRSSTHYLLQ